jgi:hypothetical protein
MSYDQIKEINYNTSNNILQIPNLKFSQETKKLYHKYRELKTITEKHLQNLANSIFKDLGLKTVPITFNGVRPHQSNGKRIVKETHGVHQRGLDGSKITVYQFTAARKKHIAAKTAISTLLHEINHNIDYNILNLKSIHTRGFYSRLKHLTAQMG